MEAEPSDRPGQRGSRWLIAIVVVSLVLRLILLLVRGADLQTDPDAYIGHAETLLTSGSYCVPGTDRPTAFRPPIYPVLLAGFGAAGVKLSSAAAIINLVASAVFIICAWWIARVVGLRGVWPPICAAAVGIDPLLLRYSVLPMTEIVSGAFLSVAILQMMKLCYESHGGSEPSGNLPGMRSAVSAGICFGVGGLCRPILFVTCAVITLILAGQFVIGRLSKKSLNGKHGGGVVVLPALIAAMILLPWVIRNAVQFNHFIPATTHGGYTLLLGNNPIFYDQVVNAPGNPAWAGDSLGQWQEKLAAQLSADGVDAADEVAADAWHYDRAIRHIGNDPTAFGKSVLLRWKRLGATRPSVQQVSGGRVMGWFATILYSIVWIGLLTSGYLWVIHHQPRVQILFGAVLSFVMMHSFYWTNTRMRAPLTAVIIVLSAVGWRYLVESIEKRTGRSRSESSTQ